MSGLALTESVHGYGPDSGSAEGEQIAPRSTPADLVASYQAADRDIREGFRLISEAVDQLRRVYTEGNSRGHISIQTHAEYVSWDDPECHLKHMRRELWRVMVERLEIRRFMSIKAWEKLCKDIEKGDVPEITEEAIGAMVKQFTDQAPAMLEAAVTEVFDFLRPPHSEYKRNSEFEVPRRVAITWIIDTWYAKCDKRAPLRPRHEVEQKLTALENVFSSLDGKGSTTKNHYSELSEAIKKTRRGELGETPYFAFRGYANGALHLEFKRADLLLRFNQIAGGSRLKPRGWE